MEVATDYNFSTPTRYDNINNTVFAPEVVPALISGGTFYWRVCGYNGNWHPMGCESYYIESSNPKTYLPLLIRQQ